MYVSFVCVRDLICKCILMLYLFSYKLIALSGHRFDFFVSRSLNIMPLQFATTSDQIATDPLSLERYLLCCRLYSCAPWCTISSSYGSRKKLPTEVRLWKSRRDFTGVQESKH